MEQKKKGVAPDIAANMGRFLLRYGDYMSNVIKTRGTPAQKQVLLYSYLGSAMELVRRDIANFFTNEQRDTLRQANDAHLRMCLTMPGLTELEVKLARESHDNINKILDTTQKDDYKLKYNLGEAQMSMLKARADQLHGEILTIIKTSTEKIKAKRYGQTMYVAPKGSVFSGMLRRLVPAAKRTTRPAPDLAKMERMVNDLATTATGSLLNEQNVNSAEVHYDKLKKLLKTLARQRIFYSLTDKVRALGDTITAVSNNDLPSARLLSQQLTTTFNGKLTLVPPSPIEEKLMARLEEMGGQQRELLPEVMRVVADRDNAFVEFILKGTPDQLPQFKDKPHKKILRVISQYFQQKPAAVAAAKQQQSDMLSQAAATAKPQQKPQLLQAAASAKQQQSDLLSQAASTAKAQQQPKLLQAAANAKQQQSDLLTQAAAAAKAQQQPKLLQAAASAKQQQADLLLQAASAAKQQEQPKLIQAAASAKQQSKTLQAARITPQQKAAATKQAQKVVKKLNLNPIIVTTKPKDEATKKAYDKAIQNALIGILGQENKQLARELRQQNPHNYKQFEKTVVEKLAQLKLKKQQQQQFFDAVSQLPKQQQLRPAAAAF